MYFFCPKKGKMAITFFKKNNNNKKQPIGGHESEEDPHVFIIYIYIFY